eukprot:2303897-Rhodomonas_salina.1
MGSSNSDKSSSPFSPAGSSAASWSRVAEDTETSEVAACIVDIWIVACTLHYPGHGSSLQVGFPASSSSRLRGLTLFRAPDVPLMPGTKAWPFNFPIFSGYTRKKRAPLGLG